MLTQSAVRKRRLISPRIVAPLLAIGALIALFLTYYLVHVRRHEQSIEDRNFRTLAAIGSQFKDQINNHAVVFRGLVEKTSQANQQDGTGHGAQKDSRGTTPTGSKRPGGDTTNANTPKKAGRPAVSLSIPVFVTVQGSKVASVDDCHFSPDLKLLRSEAAPIILTANAVPGETGPALELSYKHRCTRLLIEDSVSPLITDIPNRIFDDIILADDSGKVLYQTERSGVSANSLSFLPLEIPAKASMPAKNTAPTRPVAQPSQNGDGSTFFAAEGASNVFTVRLVGKDYRAYIVPLRLPFPRPSAAGDISELQVFLCGLVLQQHFTEEARSAPLTALVGFALGAVLVLVGAWPVLKFATVHRSDQITGWAGLFYSVTIALSVIVMTVLVIHLRYGFSDPKTDNNMQDVAKSIDQHVGIEIKRALLVMRSAAASPVVKVANFPSRLSPIPCDETPEASPTLATTDLLRNAGMEVSDYPYFRRLFVFDNLGFERYIWTVDSQPPSPLRSCDRPYFQGVQRNNLWYLTEQGLPGTRFRIDPIYSRTTGEYLAAIARPFEIRRHTGPAVNGVMAMFTPMMSLIHPVLPPDYGFAVIDPDGGVLFHSDTTKNGRENFFDQLQDSRLLRVAVASRWPTKPGLAVRYLDDDYGIFATPFNSIQSCPWTLIVFSNRAILGDKALERTVLLTLLCGTDFLVLASAVWLLLRLIPWHGMGWPDAAKVGTYVHLALALGLVGLLTYGLIFQVSNDDLPWFAILIPLSAMAVVIHKISGRERGLLWSTGLPGLVALIASIVEVWANRTSEALPYLTLFLVCAAYFSLGMKSLTTYFDSQAEKLPLRTAFSLAFVALLGLVAAVPVIACFKLTYDYDENLAARRQQLLTISALKLREQRVIDQYFQVQISGEHSSFPEDLGKWLFLRRRLEEPLDRDDNVFREQNRGEIISPQHLSRRASWVRSLESTLIWRRPESVTAMVTDDCTAGALWRWEEEGANRIRIQPINIDGRIKPADSPCPHGPRISQPGPSSSPETLALRKLAAQDPIFLAEDLVTNVSILRPWDFASETALIFLFLLFMLFLFVHFSITRMFLLNRDPGRRRVWPEITLESVISNGTNCILIDHPQSGKRNSLAAIADKIQTCDLIVALQTNAAVVTGKIVVIDHFEHRMSDSSAMRRKLDLLEQLLRDRDTKQIILLTTIDPQFYLQELASDKKNTSDETTWDTSDLEHWRLVLTRFSTFKLPGGSQCVSKFCYEVLWSSSTWSERIALYSLAKQGWPNYKNLAALDHLWTRGLITADSSSLAGTHPGFHITDPEFAKYISEQVTEPDPRSWYKHDAHGIGAGLPSALFVLVFGVLAAVLYLSRQDIFGILSGGIAALTATTKIIADLRGARQGAGKGGTQAA